MDAAGEECRIVGCGRERIARELCEMHYARARRESPHAEVPGPIVHVPAVRPTINMRPDLEERIQAIISMEPEPPSFSRWCADALEREVERIEKKTSAH